MTMNNREIQAMERALLEQEQATKRPRRINEIAREIVQTWPNPYFGAKPYLSAMHHLSTIDEMYGADTAKSVVLYFLANAQTWRGEAARRIKAELKAMVR